MLKRTITYEDYDGNIRTEDHLFHLTEAELTMLEMSEKGGYQKKLEGIIQERDSAAYISFLKELIEKSYGKKSPDGKRFIKSREIFEEFSQTEAYSQLFMDLCTDDDIGMAFVLGILPKSLSEKVKEEMDKPKEKVFDLPAVTEAE